MKKFITGLIAGALIVKVMQPKKKQGGGFAAAIGGSHYYGPRKRK